MNTVIEFFRCPSCGDDAVSDLLPAGTRVENTLDLIVERCRSGELVDVDLSPFFAPEFAICERCALVFIRKRSTPEAAARYYQRLFHVIETPLPFDVLPIPRRFLERRERIARSLVDALDGAGLLRNVRSVLHVRCNAGELLRILRDERGIDAVYGLEFLPSLIRHAREVHGLENVAPIRAPEFENPFRRDRFDLVICNEVFGHAHVPSDVARSVAGLIGDSGVAVAYNEKDHSMILNSNKIFPHGMNFFHKQLYTRGSLRSFLETSGFAVTELPHPTIGKTRALKNSKILYVLRRGAATPELPSGEVDAMKRLFRRWWTRHRWYKRWLRVRRAFVRPRQVPGGGGAARL